MNLPSAAGSVREGKRTGFTGGSDRGWPAGSRSSQEALAHFISSSILGGEERALCCTGFGT